MRLSGRAQKGHKKSKGGKNWSDDEKAIERGHPHFSNRALLAKPRPQIPPTGWLTVTTSLSWECTLRIRTIAVTRRIRPIKADNSIASLERAAAHVNERITRNANPPTLEDCVLVGAEERELRAFGASSSGPTSGTSPCTPGGSPTLAGSSTSSSSPVTTNTRCCPGATEAARPTRSSGPGRAGSEPTTASNLCSKASRGSRKRPVRSGEDSAEAHARPAHVRVSPSIGSVTFSFIAPDRSASGRGRPSIHVSLGRQSELGTNGKVVHSA